MSTNLPGSTSASATLNGSDDPWALAKARFLSDLDPSERDLFNNATLENLYYTTSISNRDDAEKSRVRGVATKLGPLVSAIESYGKALDTFAQIAPLYLAPIWGSIRVVLILAKSYGKFFERFVDTLGRIGDVLPRFRDYERIYSREKHQRLTQALSNAYLDIIVLCTQFRKTLREQKASSFRRLLKPMTLDKQFDEAVERFRQHKKTIDEEARICHMIEAAEKRDKELIHFATERKQRLLLKLSTVGYEYKHQKLKAVRHADTGTWLIKDSLFEQWQLSTPVSSVLCCYGIPGCGKSILSSSIVDHFATSNHVIYYYCDYADKRTLDPANFFGTLARQVLKNIELVPEPLAIAIEEAGYDGNRLTDHSCAFDLLLKCIATCAVPLFVSIDGLDEMTDESQKITCQYLRQVMNNEQLSVKLFLTGREDLKPLLRLNSVVPFSRISITASLISSDIRSYVQASTRRRIVEGALVLGDKALEGIIVDELVKSAQGMFLWVEFQLCDLCEAETDHAIKLVLQNLPKSLSETYDRLLGKIEGFDRREMILKMFKWIVCARRPLQVDELREGVAFNLNDEEWIQEKVLTNFNRLVRACGNLVVIDDAAHTVTLAHFTVEQYLLQDQPGFFRFSTDDANEMAGDFCLAYLNFSNFETSMTTYKKNANTELVALEKLATNGPLVTLNPLGHKAVQAWRAVRGVDKASPDINMTRYGPRTKPRMQQSLDKFVCLDYVITHWLSHTSQFIARVIPEQASRQRRDRLFGNLISWKTLPFHYRHWQSIDDSNRTQTEEFTAICLLGWALVENHAYLLEIFLRSNRQFTIGDLLDRAWSRFNSVTKGLIDEWHAQILVRFKEEKYPSTSVGSNHHWFLSRLLWACQKGNVDVLSRCGLIKNHWENSLQHLVITMVRSEATGVIQKLVENKFPQAYNLQDNSKEALLLLLSDRSGWQSALEKAVVAGQVKSTRYLRDKGFKVNELFPDAESYLCSVADAIAKSSPTVLECVLAVRTILPYDIDIVDRYIVVSQALLYGDDAGLELPEILERHGMKPDIQTIIGCVISDSQVLERFLDMNPLPFAFIPGTIQDQFFSALEQKSQTAIQRFLDMGINPNIPHSSGSISIVDAIRSGNLQLVESLCRYGCSVRYSPFGLPLSIAAAMGHLPIAETLIRYGAEIFGIPDQDQKGMILAELLATHHDNTHALPLICLSPTPLFMACHYGRKSIVEMLLLRGASKEFPSPTRRFSCVGNQNGGVITICSNRTIGPDGEDFQCLIDLDLGQDLVSEWKYPVAAAIEYRHSDIVELLLHSSLSVTSAGNMQALLGLSDAVRMEHQSQLEIQNASFDHFSKSDHSLSWSGPLNHHISGVGGEQSRIYSYSMRKGTRNLPSAH